MDRPESNILVFPSCVALDNLLNNSEPLCPYLEKEIRILSLARCLTESRQRMWRYVDNDVILAHNKVLLSHLSLVGGVIRTITSCEVGMALQ